MSDSSPIEVPAAGSALLSVLLIFAVISFLIVEMIRQQFVHIRRTNHLVAEEQALVYLQAAEELAIRALDQDIQDDMKQYGNPVDDLNDEWAKAVTFPLEGGSIQAELQDLQSKLNINMLKNKNFQNEIKLWCLSFLDQSKRMATPQLSVDMTLDEQQEWLDNMVDWLDEDDEVQPYGAESNYYLMQSHPYRNANQPFMSDSEILLVKGVTASFWQQIRRYLTTLPPQATININTVDEVLFSAYPNLTDEDIDILLKSRTEGGFKSVNDAFDGLSGSPKAHIFSVYSEFFILRAKVIIDDRTVLSNSVIYRTANPSDLQPIRVIARSYQADWMSNDFEVKP